MLTKHAPKLLTLLLALLITGGILAAKAPAEPKQYDYVTIIQMRGGLRITSGNNKFDVVDLDRNLKTGNFIQILGKVNEFEAQGYELVENVLLDPEQGENVRNYFLLRKAK
jgi:hypothetical protein